MSGEFKVKKIIVISFFLLALIAGYLYSSQDLKFEPEYSGILETLHHYGKTPVEVIVPSEGDSCVGLTDNLLICKNIKETMTKNDMTTLIYSRGTAERLSISGSAHLTDDFSTSFLYSSDDNTEETQVSDLKEAIKKAHATQKQDRSSFHFCQKLKQAHWFICANEIE
jgi:hypothetical protein